jgi:hypothetical protein
MKYLVKSILLVLIAAVPARAQFSDSVHYMAGLALSGNINTTDKGQNMVFNNGLRLGVKKEHLELNSNTSWIYGQQQQQLTNNDLNSTLDFNRFVFWPRFNYWGLANYNSSYSLKINNQYQAGAGVAYGIFEENAFKLKVSDGIILESSDIFLADTVREVYSTWRNSLRITAKATWSICTINYSGFWQPSLNDGSDYIIRSNISGSVKLKKWLSFTTSFTYNRFNRTGKENALFTYGITLENYF